jgi:hypothetical protein
MRILNLAIALLSLSAALVLADPLDTFVGHGINPTGKACPVVNSPDGKWQVDAGLHIIDLQTGHPVFFFNDPSELVGSSKVEVSWSPYSQRVVLVNTTGKSYMLFGTELMGNTWNVTPIPRPYLSPEGVPVPDPGRPANTRVERIELGNWISASQLEVKLSYQVSPTALWVSQTAVLEFQKGALFFTND